MQRTPLTVGVERTDLTAVTHSFGLNNPPGSVPVAAPSMPVAETAPAPDPNIGRCIQLKLDGTRCNGRAIPGKQGFCMVHCERNVDEAK